MTIKENESFKMSLRIEHSQNKELKEYIALHNMNKTDFIRKAITEKLHRKSIEENLEIAVKTDNIESKLTTIEEKLNEKITNLQDISLSLQERINTRLDQQAKLLQHVLDILLLKPAFEDLLETKKGISLETKILDILIDKPTKDLELALELELTNTEIKETLDKLLADNKITLHKGVYRLL
jgi:hypothetical protein